MATNNFKAFALDPNANVMSQADWEALPALLSGFTAGKASSAQVNKAIRQASFIAAALAQYTSDKTGDDVLDDGDQAAFIAKMAAAFGKDFQPLDATLTALAALTGAVDKLPYFNGADTAALTALTTVGRDIIGKSSIADVLSYLGLSDLVLAGVGNGSLGTTGYAEIPLVISGAKKILLLCWGVGSTGSNGSFTQSFAKAFPTAVLCKLVANSASTSPSGFAGASTTLSTISIYSASAAGTASSSGVVYNYLAIGY